MRRVCRVCVYMCVCVCCEHSAPEGSGLRTSWRTWQRRWWSSRTQVADDEQLVGTGGSRGSRAHVCLVNRPGQWVTNQRHSTKNAQALSSVRTRRSVMLNCLYVCACVCCSCVRREIIVDSHIALVRAQTLQPAAECNTLDTRRTHNGRRHGAPKQLE